jgi:hypothetical protein
VDKKFVVTLKIVPNSSKFDIIKEDDFIKIKITAPPVENKANKVLVEFLAKKLSVPKTSIEIVRGGTSKIKTLSIDNIDEEYFNKKIFN